VGRDEFARVFALVHISLFISFFLSEEFFPETSLKKRHGGEKSPWKKKKKKKNRDACGRRHRRILRSTETYFSINSYSAMRCDFHSLCVQAMI